VPKLTAIVITRNEAANIDAVLESLAWADEILVVDAESTDDTADRARAHGARVCVRPWPGFSAQKNFAASQASHDWILVVDADERLERQFRDRAERVIRRGCRFGLAAFALAGFAVWGVKNFKKEAPSQTAVEPAVNTRAQEVVYYFYTNYRCPTCLKLEAYTKEAVEKVFAEEIKRGVRHPSLEIRKSQPVQFLADQLDSFRQGQPGGFLVDGGVGSQCGDRKQGQEQCEQQVPQVHSPKNAP